MSRRRSDDDWPIIVAAVVFIIGMAIWVGTRPTPPPPEPAKPPTAEQVGKAVGKTSRNFGKGFIEGFRNPD